MRGARRRPYVDMVKPGNKADARPGRNPEGRGDLGAFCRREPLQYRHIAAGSPPKTASHIASVAHVPIIEIGSSNRIHGRISREAVLRVVAALLLLIGVSLLVRALAGG